jgi:hypothetical protein
VWLIIYDEDPPYGVPNGAKFDTAIDSRSHPSIVSLHTPIDHRSRQSIVDHANLWKPKTAKIVAIFLPRFFSESRSICRGFFGKPIHLSRFCFRKADPIIAIYLSRFFSESCSDYRDFSVEIFFGKLIPLPRFFFRKADL